MDDPALANDKYQATLRSTWIYDPADTELLVDAIPQNVPSIITVGWQTEYETVFRIEDTSGDNSSNYALTGVTRLKGYEGNLPEGLAVNCLNNEEYFNQWGDQIAAVQETAESADETVTDLDTIVNQEWIDLDDESTINLDLDTGVNRKFRVTIAGNREITVSNPKLGQVFILAATQDGSGNRALTFFSGISWEGGIAPTQLKTASTTDTYGFIVTNASTPTFLGFVMGSSMKVPA